MLLASRGSTWLPLTRSGPSQLGGSDLVRSRACQRLNPTPPVARFPGLSFPLPPVPLLPIWAAPGLLHGFRGTEALPTAGASAPLPPRGPGWGGCAQRAVRPLSLANGRRPAPAAPTGARGAGGRGPSSSGSGMTADTTGPHAGGHQAPLIPGTAAAPAAPKPAPAWALWQREPPHSLALETTWTSTPA